MSRLTISVLLLAFSSVLVVAADKKDKEDIAVDRHEKVIAEAKKRVEDAKRKAAQAKSLAERMDDEARKQKVEHDKIRQSVSDKHDADPQLVKIRRGLEQAEADWKAVSLPILKQLAGDPAFEALVQNRDKARQHLQMAPSGERERLAAAVLAANQAISRAENAALDANPAALAAKQKCDHLRSQLKPLTDERDRKIAADPQLQRSSQEIAGSKRQAEQAFDALEKAIRDFAMAQKHLDSEEAEHRRLVQAERRDDARDRQGAKKNNKKK